jgi:hypothetical protein
MTIVYKFWRLFAECLITVLDVVSLALVCYRLRFPCSRAAQFAEGRLGSSVTLERGSGNV